MSVGVEVTLHGMTAADFEADPQVVDCFRSAVASASDGVDASQVVVETFLDDYRNATTAATATGVNVGFKVLLPAATAASSDPQTAGRAQQLQRIAWAVAEVLGNAFEPRFVAALETRLGEGSRRVAVKAAKELVVLAYEIQATTPQPEKERVMPAKGLAPQWYGYGTAMEQQDRASSLRRRLNSKYRPTLTPRAPVV